MNCGKLLADKWLYYQKERAKRLGPTAAAKRTYFDGTDIPETVEAEIMKELGLDRYCCRKAYLGHVDLIPKL
jgi:DNA-directed RNA polymerase subunit N (RpoN/RPB10)